MRFMLLRKADEATEAGVMPSQQLLAAMGAYMEALAKAGVLLAGGGLQPSSKGARVTFSGGKPAVTEGPFAGATELLSGFVMIQVPSKQAAIECGPDAGRRSMAAGRSRSRFGRCTNRRISDWSPGPTREHFGVN